MSWLLDNEFGLIPFELEELQLVLLNLNKLVAMDTRSSNLLLDLDNMDCVAVVGIIDGDDDYYWLVDTISAPIEARLVEQFSICSLSFLTGQYWQ